jgi:hypothetical protein
MTTLMKKRTEKLWFSPDMFEQMLAIGRDTRIVVEAGLAQLGEDEKDGHLNEEEEVGVVQVLSKETLGWRQAPQSLIGHVEEDDGHQEEEEAEDVRAQPHLPRQVKDGSAPRSSTARGS